MNSRKNILAIMLLIMVCITFFTISSYASSDKRKQPIDLTTKTSDGNPAKDIDKLSKEGWKWEAVSKTLTLESFELNVKNSKAKSAIYLPANSKIVLLGSNKLTAVNLCAISTKDNGSGSLTICGLGNLKIYTNGHNSEAIKLNSSNLNIEDCKVIVDSSNDYESIFDCGGKLNLNLSNAILNCTSYKSEAINIYGKINLNGTNLIVKSKDSCAIYSQQGITSNKSKLKVESISCNAIETMSDVEFKNCTVNVNSNSYGIYLGNNAKLTINNTKLKSNNKDSKKVYLCHKNNLKIINSEIK